MDEIHAAAAASNLPMVPLQATATPSHKDAFEFVQQWIKAAEATPTLRANLGMLFMHAACLLHRTSKSKDFRSWQSPSHP